MKTHNRHPPCFVKKRTGAPPPILQPPVSSATRAAGDLIGVTMVTSTGAWTMAEEIGKPDELSETEALLKFLQLKGAQPGAPTDGLAFGVSATEFGRSAQKQDHQGS